VWGNNAFSSANMVASANAPYDGFDVTTALTLAPGQSLSLAYFTFLARDLGRASQDVKDADVALAMGTTRSLRTSPYFADLSQQEIAGIANFDTSTTTPEPGTWALLATGLLGVGGIARRTRRTRG
jgi:hypothetical protein